MTKLPMREELLRETKYLLSDGTFACSLRLNRLRQLLTTLDLLAEMRDAGQRLCDCSHDTFDDAVVKWDALLARMKEMGVEW